MAESGNAITVEELQIRITAEYGDAIRQMLKMVEEAKKVLAAKLEPIADDLTKKIDSIKPATDALSKTMSTAVKKMDGISKTAAKTSEQLEKLQKASEGLRDIHFEVPESDDFVKDLSRISVGVQRARENMVGLNRAYSEHIQLRARLNGLRNATAKKRTPQSSIEDIVVPGKTLEGIIANATRTMDAAKKKAAEMRGTIHSGDAQLMVKTAAGKINNYSKTITDLQKTDAAVKNIAKSVQKIEPAAKSTKTSFSEILKVLRSAVPPSASLVKQTKKITKLGLDSLLRKIKNGFSGLSKPLRSFNRNIRNVLTFGLLYKAINAVSDSLRTGVNNLYQYSKTINGTFAASMDRLSASMQYFRNSVGAAVSPIINELTPAIDTAVDHIVELINSLNQLIAKLSGASSWTKAVKVQKEYAESAEKAADAQKGMLAGFDELNVVQQQNGGGSSGSEDYGSMFETVPLDGYTLPDFIQQIKERLEQGDWSGVGRTLGEKVNEIVEGTDFYSLGQKLGEKITNALTMATSFLDTVNFSDIGARIAEFFNGIFAEVDFTKLGELFAQQFTSLVEMIYGFITTFDWAEFIRSIGEFISRFFSELGESFDMSGLESLGESIKKVFDGIAERLAPFAEIITTQIAPAFKETLNAALEALAAVIDNVLRPAFEWLWDNAFQPLAEWASTNIIVPALDSLRDVFQKIADVLNGELSFNEFIDGLSPIQGLALAVATAVVTVTTAFTAASAAIKVATTVVSGVKAAIALLSSPIGIAVAAVTALIGVGVLLYQNWDTVKSTAISVWTYIKDFFGEVGRVIKQDIDSVVERFTNFGNSVKQVFEDLWDRLKIIINFVIGGIEKMTNGVIKGINKMIGALNGLSFDVPDWVPLIGGEKFGLSIPTISEISIPRLASGAVITSPTLGLMGEYPNAASNPEIVTPQKLLYETVTSANAEQNALLREQNSLLRQLLRKEATVNIGASAALGKVNRRSEELYAALVGG